MRNVIRIPHILLPIKDFAHWSVIACDQFTSDRSYWEKVARSVGNRPSSLHCILPEAYLGEEDEERIKSAHESMYEAFTDRWLEKLNRGFVLTKRKTFYGVRKGIVAAIDLEAYSYKAGEENVIRSSEEVVPGRLPPRVALRRGAILEFPHAIVFYKDKKNKLISALEEEDLEELYNFNLMEGGGNIKGYFIPEDLAAVVAQSLHTRGDPCFAVADGNHSVAAAKAYWEELKGELSEREQRTHPARFTLVEFVNLYDDSVVFTPIHRIVKHVDKEAFCDYFQKAVKCRRVGDLLYPALAGGGAGVARADELIEAYLKANTGAVDYIHGEKQLNQLSEEENCVGVVLAEMEKDDFFEQLKGGKNFPKKTFSLGKAQDKRYYLEGREISYD